MAQQESDHDDLMREAVSLKRRAELSFPSQPMPVLLGFNDLGWLFVYVGTDPAYRFDHEGRLRRAFVDGLLYRTEGSSLSCMRRERTDRLDDSPTESRLLRRTLSAVELDEFRMRTQSRVQVLFAGIDQASIMRQVPDGDESLRGDLKRGLLKVVESVDFLAPAIVRRMR